MSICSIWYAKISRNIFKISRFRRELRQQRCLSIYMVIFNKNMRKTLNLHYRVTSRLCTPLKPIKILPLLLTITNFNKFITF